MKKIDNKDIPLDNLYHRSSSTVYRDYLIDCGLQVIPVGNMFGWLKNLIGTKIQLAKFERIDTEPTKEMLKEAGFNRGMVFWVPCRRTEIPKGWRKLWFNSHFTTTGFATIEGEDYYKKWNERGKRARKKFLSNPELTIKEVTNIEFVDAFKNTKVKHMFKREYITFYEKIYNISPESVRSFVCYYQDKPISGLAVLDNNESSIHLVAFTNRKYNKLQAGTGLIDYWFKQSFEKGIKYMDFDHLRDSIMTPDQQGYSEFKKNFIEHLCLFKDCYFKFMSTK